MTMKSDAKFEEKLTCGLENDMRNMASFYQNTRKCQDWTFDGVLLYKVKNKFTEELCVIEKKNYEKSEEELS